MNLPYRFIIKVKLQVCYSSINDGEEKKRKVSTRRFLSLDYDDDDDDDESLMRQVLAMSQIEYVETLKKQQEQASKSSDPDQPSSSSNTDFL